MYTTTKKTLALLAVAVVAMAGVFIITTADSGESDAVTISADSSGSCSLTAGDYLCIRGTSGDQYSLHSVSAPPWLSYNSTAETLTGNAVAGTYEVTFEIMYYDGHGNHDVTIDIYVSPANQQPTYYTYTLIYDAAGGVGGPGTVHVSRKSATTAFSPYHHHSPPGVGTHSAGGDGYLIHMLHAQQEIPSHLIRPLTHLPYTRNGPAPPRRRRNQSLNFSSVIPIPTTVRL